MDSVWGKLAVSINSYGNVGIKKWKLSWYASWVQKEELNYKAWEVKKKEQIKIDSALGKYFLNSNVPKL